jgi:zinc transport system permease protein
MIEPFLLRSLAGGLGLAAVAAPFGCMVVWQRMAYFGETIANASLIGLAIGVLLKADMTVAAIVASLAVAAILVLLTRQTLVAMDALLGLLAHGALAAGLVAMALAKGPSVDLMGYLIGDLFAITTSDLAWIGVGGAVAIGLLAIIWPRLLALAIHEELAIAEGIDHRRTKAVFILLLALVVAMAMKIIGLLLVVAFFIMPAVAARPFSRTPEQMALLAAGIGIAGVLAGFGLSLQLDVPGGPAIVLVLAAMAGGSLVASAFTTTGRTR